MAINQAGASFCNFSTIDGKPGDKGIFDPFHNFRHWLIFLSSMFFFFLSLSSALRRGQSMPSPLFLILHRQHQTDNTIRLFSVSNKRRPGLICFECPANVVLFARGWQETDALKWRRSYGSSSVNTSGPPLEHAWRHHRQSGFTLNRYPFYPVSPFRERLCPHLPMISCVVDCIYVYYT